MIAGTYCNMTKEEIFEDLEVLLDAMEKLPKKLQDIPETVYASREGDVFNLTTHNKLFQTLVF